jgi:ABC-2 type transport system ATP-binding protein
MLLDDDRIVAEGTATELERQVADQRLELTLGDSDAFEDVAAALGDRAAHADPSALIISVPTDGSAVHVRGLLDELDPGGDAVARFVVQSATLDDVFLTLTGQKATRPEMETTDV